MTPLVLPIDRGELAGHVARLWLDAARESGVDPARVGCDVTPVPGGFDVRWSPRASGRPMARDNARALSRLADALEDAPLYLAVSRDSGIRVLGWAAVQVNVTTIAGRARDDVRIAWLDVTDPRRQAHDDAVRAARDARLAATAVPPGAPGTRSRGDAARERERERR